MPRNYRLDKVYIRYPSYQGKDMNNMEREALVEELTEIASDLIRTRITRLERKYIARRLLVLVSTTARRDEDETI